MHPSAHKSFHFYIQKTSIPILVYADAEDYELFRKVHAAGETIEWETGEDVSPESLYLNSIKQN